MNFSYETIQSILTILIEICGFIVIAVLPAIYIIETNIKEVKSWGNPEVTQQLILEISSLEQIKVPIKNDATQTEKQEKTKSNENRTPTKTPKSKRKSTENDQTKTTNTRKKQSSKTPLINNIEPLAT